MPRAAREVIRIGCRSLKAVMSIGRDNKMPSKIGHGVLISITVIALLFASVMTSYSETTTYIYDELNWLIQVIYEDGRGVIYTYDASGNRIILASYPDTVPPTGTIIINSGDAVTYNPSVTLALTCSDNVGCSQMQFSNDNVTYSTPEAYGPTKSWTLSAGDGTKTVYAKFKDAAGNWSTAYSDTIDLITDSYTKSLLHMNGTDGSTTFTDSAVGGAHTWTAHGNAQIDTAQSKFGGASGLFDGTGDYLTTPYSADFDFGTNNFTWDFWIRWNAFPSSGTSSVFITVARQTNNNNVNVFYLNNNAGVYRLYFVAIVGGVTKASYYTTNGISVVTNVWYHFACVRSGSSFYIFFSGTSQSLTTSVAIGTNSITPAINEATSIARYGNYTGYDYNGWLDEVRISKGIARWTSNFTPPTNQYYP